MNRLAEIEDTITGRAADSAALRGEGARILADTGASGATILTWLTAHGATDVEARNVCVDIVKERRSAADATADVETLALIDAGRILLRSPADGFGLTGPEPIPYPTARRVMALKERGLAGPAYQVRGESYPAGGWPQPYVLTEAGREALAAFQTAWTEANR